MGSKKSAAFTTVFFLFLFFSSAYAQVVYSDPERSLNIHKQQIGFFEDKKGTLDVKTVARLNQFKPVPGTGDVPNFGITGSAYWLRISVTNLTSLRVLILKINQPIIDEIEFYTQRSAPDSFKVVKRGEYKPFELRDYQTPEYLFDLDIKPGTTQTYYIRIKCRENMQVPMSIASRISVFNSSSSYNLASGIYIGIMMVMILYNLFIFLIFRKDR